MVFSPVKLPKKGSKNCCLPQADHWRDARPVVSGNEQEVDCMGEEEAKLRQLHAGHGFLDGLGHLDTCCRQKVVAIPAGACLSLQTTDFPIKADRQHKYKD